MRFDDQLSLILESFNKGHLYKGLWSANGEINEKVSDNLKQIAYDFMKQHKITNDVVSDIIITGSMANYNWTKYSDIDLHILIDHDKIKNNSIFDEYYQMAKSVWNDKHNILVCDHEVEIYVQDDNDPHHSTGVYSLLTDKWITKPRLSDKLEHPPKESVLRKAQKYIDRINSISINNKDASNIAKRIMDEMKEMRMEGLRTSGEYSIENLAYKHLRNKGYIDKLKKIGLKTYDKSLSVDNCDQA